MRGNSKRVIVGDLLVSVSPLAQELFCSAAVAHISEAALMPEGAATSDAAMSFAHLLYTLALARGGRHTTLLNYPNVGQYYPGIEPRLPRGCLKGPAAEAHRMDKPRIRHARLSSSLGPWHRRGDSDEANRQIKQVKQVDLRHRATKHAPRAQAQRIERQSAVSVSKRIGLLRRVRACMRDKAEG